MNFGYSSRLGYDTCSYDDKINQSVSPMDYYLDVNRSYNCNQCFSSLGVRSSYGGNSVSTYTGFPVATSQSLVDIESVLSNRNMKLSKCRNAEVNRINVNKLRLKNLENCNKFLDPTASRLTLPVANYRDIAINRFYDLQQNPQNNIYWDNAINSSLELKDNYIEKLLGPFTNNKMDLQTKPSNKYP